MGLQEPEAVPACGFDFLLKWEVKWPVHKWEWQWWQCGRGQRYEDSGEGYKETNLSKVFEIFLKKPVSR